MPYSGIWARTDVLGLKKVVPSDYDRIKENRKLGPNNTDSM